MRAKWKQRLLQMKYGHGDSPQEDVDITLWVASNGPARPADWATMSEPETSCWDDTSSCDATACDFPSSYLAAPSFNFLGHPANHGEPPAVRPLEDLDDDLFVHTDVLPDVPDGTGSVDLLACHVPLGPVHLPDLLDL